MSVDLSKLKKGKVSAPPLMVIYGAPGIGKTAFGVGTTAANNFGEGKDSHILMNIDFRGADRLACNRLFDAPVKGLDDIKIGFQALAEQEHNFKWLCIDDLSTLERLFVDEVCKENNVDAIGKIDYGRGYELAKAKWDVFFKMIKRLQEVRKIGVLIVGHTNVEQLRDPMSESYTRHDLQLDRRSKAIVKNAVELIGFAHKKVYTKEVDSGFTKELRAIDKSERVLTIAPDIEGFESKDRFRLPSEMVLDWDVFAAHLKEVLK
jgi:hypothetical protein